MYNSKVFYHVPVGITLDQKMTKKQMALQAADREPVKITFDSIVKTVIRDLRFTNYEEVASFLLRNDSVSLQSNRVKIRVSWHNVDRWEDVIREQGIKAPVGILTDKLAKTYTYEY